MFHQLLTPVGDNLALSFVVAAAPIAVVLVMLGGRVGSQVRRDGHVRGHGVLRAGGRGRDEQRRREQT